MEQNILISSLNNSYRKASIKSTRMQGTIIGAQLFLCNVNDACLNVMNLSCSVM